MSENAEKLSSLNKRKKLFELGFTNENIGKLKKSEINDIINKSIKASDFEFTTDTSKNELTIFQGNVIKYVIRYPYKGGIEDLEKIKHYCDLEIKKMKDAKRKK